MGVERGSFVVFEGGESVGKSTQAGWLAMSRGAELTAEPQSIFQPQLFYEQVEVTFEPGRTLIGQELRRSATRIQPGVACTH